MTELHHVNVKLLVQDPEHLDLDLLVPIFHNWIRDQVCEERLLDVADYRHVFAGPGVMLIGLEGDYSLDNTDRRLGFRYNRKAVLPGDNQGRLGQAATAALKACQRLESEPTLGGSLRFNGQDLEISINDRLLVPNCQEMQQAFHAEFQRFADRLFGGTDYILSYCNDRSRLFTVFLRGKQPLASQTFLANLAR